MICHNYILYVYTMIFRKKDTHIDTNSFQKALKSSSVDAVQQFSYIFALPRQVQLVAIHLMTQERYPSMMERLFYPKKSINSMYMKRSQEFASILKKLQKKGYIQLPKTVISACVDIFDAVSRDQTKESIGSAYQTIVYTLAEEKR